MIFDPACLPLLSVHAVDQLRGDRRDEKIKNGFLFDYLILYTSVKREEKRLKVTAMAVGKLWIDTTEYGYDIYICIWEHAS
jgi:hypothetical protein